MLSDMGQDHQKLLRFIKMFYIFAEILITTVFTSLKFL